MVAEQEEGDVAIATPSEAHGHFLYFAYGSNLLKERIHVQVRGAVFLSVGELASHELRFFDASFRWHGALASIEPGGEGSRVWGCIWRVPDTFAEELDRQESGYHRLDVSVRAGESLFRCRSYQYSNPHRRAGAPSPHYHQVIVAGALEHCLPPDYVQWLRRIPTNGYCGRVELELSAIAHLNYPQQQEGDVVKTAAQLGTGDTNYCS